MKIYENVFIGTFIFSLGVKVGQRGMNNPFVPAAVSLFQQTPADTFLGDLFTSFGGRNLLIEFKANKLDKDEKELGKILELRDALAKEKNIELKKISHICHYFAQCTISTQCTDIDFRPYLLANTQSGNSNELNAFIDMILDGNAGVEGEQFGKYVELLRGIYSDGRSSSTGGLLMNIDENGNAVYIASANLGDLLETIQSYEDSQTNDIQDVSPLPSPQ